MMKKVCIALIGALTLIVSTAHAAPAASVQAEQLRAKYGSLTDALKTNPYKRPLHIESAETSSMLNGDVYAVVPHPFSAVSAALTEAGHWCDIMILPVNTKDCRVGQASAGGVAVSIRIGRKEDQELEDAYPIEFAMRIAEKTPEYLSVRLDADIGPMATRDYRVQVEATPIENGKTFLHLHYSYGFGMAGRIAMQAYLATAGANKVGFTSSGGKLVGGTRGVVERNAMRYYLAIDAYLAAASSPAPAQVERRLQSWFDSSEQYARQLHELERGEYVAMKRREIQRQRSPQEIVRVQPPSDRF